MNDATNFDEIEALPIVFIVGKGRSGTTLLQTLLDGHPNNVAPVESRYVLELKQQYAKINTWTTSLRSELLRDIKQESQLAFFWNLRSEWLEKSIYEMPDNANFTLVCKLVAMSCSSFFPKETPKVVIIKSPIHSFFIRELVGIIPTARFVHLVRDYRANAFSHKKMLPNQSLKWLTYKWVGINGLIEESKKLYPENFYTLRFEELIAQPRLKLSELCKFIGIDFSDNLLNHQSHVNAMSIASYLDHSDELIATVRKSVLSDFMGNLTRPISPSVNEKWRCLDKTKIIQLERFGNLLADSYGYKSVHSTDKIWSLKRLTYQIRFVAITMKLKLYYRLPIRWRVIVSGEHAVIAEYINAAKKTLSNEQ